VKLLINGSRLAGVDANSTRRLSALKAKKPAGALAGEPLRLLGDAMQRARQYRPGSVAGGVRLIRSGAQCTAAFPRYDLLSATPRFRWVDESGGSAYTLVVRDSAFSVVARRSVRGGVIDSACTLPRGCTYYWQVERADTALASNIAMFTVLSDDSAEELRRELVRLDGELRAMRADGVLRHLARALYFERKGLFMDAAQEYRDVIALRPSTEEYRNLFLQLLQSINLYAESEVLLQ
jgi:hypothetical protein